MKERAAYERGRPSPLSTLIGGNRGRGNTEYLFNAVRTLNYFVVHCPTLFRDLHLAVN